MALSASAQVTWNAKLGGGIAMCAAGNDEGDMKGVFVGKIGFGLEKPITPDFSIMPSLELALKGTEWSYSAKGYSHTETYSPIYVQIPVLGAYRLNINDDWNLTIKAGPYFAYGIGGKIKLNEIDHGEQYFDDADMFSDLDAKRFDAGIDAGIDFEYHRFVIGVEYERGFISFAPSDADVNIFNQAVYATVGYKF